MKRLILVLALTGEVQAQSPHLGGQGDGHAGAGVVNRALDGASSPPDLFVGGSADGHDGKTLANWNLGPPAPAGSSLPAFAGPGGGDGHSGMILANWLLGPSPAPGSELPALAGPGGGDGFSAAALSNQRLGPASDPAWDIIAYASAAGGDGFASAVAANLSVTPPPPSDPYLAGAGGGDGFGAASMENQMLGDPPDPDSQIVAFSGTGGGDGFSGASLIAFSLSDAAFPFVQHTGGASGGDGFAAAAILNHSFGDLNLPDFVFFGGPGDGFDHFQISNFGMDFRLGSPVNYSNFQLALFTPAEISAGLAVSTVDADGDGVANLIEFALGTDPRSGASNTSLPPYLISPAAFGLPPDGATYLTLDIPRTPNALGVALGVEFTSTLGTSTWDSETCVPLINTPSRLVVRDCIPVGSAPARFARVTASLSAP